MLYMCAVAMLYMCADTTISTPIHTGNGGWGGGHGTSFHMGMPGRCFFIIFIFIFIFQIFPLFCTWSGLYFSFICYALRTCKLKPFYGLN